MKRYTPTSKESVDSKSSIHSDGFTLLITILIMGILLAVSGSLMHVTLKQYQLSGIARASEIAFHAANAGIECAQYNDLHESSTSDDPEGKFNIGSTSGSINCMKVDASNSVGTIASGESQPYEFTWGGTWRQVGGHWDWSGTDYDKCTKLEVIKFNNNEVMSDAGRRCPSGTTCTVIKSRGYNATCAVVNNGTNPRVVERELIFVY